MKSTRSSNNGGLEMPGRTTIQKKLVRTSLSVLVPTFIAGTLAVVALIIYLGAKNQAAAVSRFEASLTAKGRLITSNNAQALVGMAEGNAFIQIRDLVSSTVRDDHDVVYGLFLPADSTNPCEMSDESDSASRDGLITKEASIGDQAGVAWARSAHALETRRSGSGASERLEFVAPVGDPVHPTGWILYELSTTAMSEAIQSERTSASRALFGAVALLLAIVTGTLAYTLAKFRSEAETLSKPVRELVAAAEIIRGGDFKTLVRVESDDEIGALASTFETMRQTVQMYTEHLEDLVAEKMRQVRDILDSVDQGLVVLNFDGTLSPEYSKASPEILGVTELKQIREAFRLSPSQEADFLSWLDLVRQKHATMRWEKLAKLAPVQELELPGPDGRTRCVRVRYQRMYDKNRQVERIMVLAQDETENRRIERIVAEEQERHEDEVKTIMGLVNNLPEVIRDFMGDARSRIDRSEDLCRSMLDRSVAARQGYPEQKPFAPTHEEIGKIFRNFHTIKGNAATYGFERLTRLAHQGEDFLEDLKTPITVRTSQTLGKILEKLDEMDKAYIEILATEKKLTGGGGEGETLVHICESKLDHIRRLARTLQEGSHPFLDSEAVRILAHACEHIRDVPLPKLADKYRGMVQRLSQRLGKQICLEVLPPHLEVGPSFFAPLDEALVHMFRNCVDHGIELPDDRIALGKPQLGSIRLEVLSDEDKIAVILSDDGAGIDVETIAAKAVEQGVISLSDAQAMDAKEKLMLIFESGLSTASTITDVSGRGVGMSAVRDSIEALGGTISVSTKVGQGTRFVVEIPQRGS